MPISNESNVSNVALYAADVTQLPELGAWVSLSRRKNEHPLFLH